jgi:putative sugar O-methyltransferase
VLWKYLHLNPADRHLRITSGLADHRRPGSVRSAGDRRIAERICAAYRLSKRDEPKAKKPYQVRGLWAEMIKVNYGPLMEAVTRSDIDAVCSLLENFSREQFAVGTGAGYDDYVHYRTSILGGQYVKAVWCEYRDALLGSGFDLSKIRFPSVGNPFGVPLNGDIIQIETLRHALYASTIAHLLSDLDSPVIVEIGGGFGGQAFQVVTQCLEGGRPVQKYLDYDIPEVQIVASYFLLKALPASDIRLYGEGGETTEFTIGLFPHFAIESLGDMSADLVFNSHSFSEMASEASQNYLAVCTRICRKYFLHVNHETPLVYKEADGTITRNLLGSQMVPDPGLFKRVYKFPRLVQRPEDRFDTSFEYLYERR